MRRIGTEIPVERKSWRWLGRHTKLLLLAGRPRRNATGQWLASRYVEVYCNGEEPTDAGVRALYHCTRAAAAVRRYQLRHGTLPATLDDLVPDLLAKVPEDPFDGQSLRYSRGSKVIYAVGADFADVGGHGIADEMSSDTDVGVSF